MASTERAGRVVAVCRMSFLAMLALDVAVPRRRDSSADAQSAFSSLVRRRRPGGHVRAVT